MKSGKLALFGREWAFPEAVRSIRLAAAQPGHLTIGLAQPQYEKSNYRGLLKLRFQVAFPGSFSNPLLYHVGFFKMTGVEAAGFVLGVLPLIISAAKHYKDVFKPFNRYRKFAPELELYYQQLRT
jgi:hypothetical protein